MAWGAIPVLESLTLTLRPSSPSSSPSPSPESTLVYGRDETGVSALATGLALKVYPRFRWVDCARGSPVDDLPVHWIFARGSTKPEMDWVDATGLRPATWTASSLRALVTPEGPDEDRRLASFLALPDLFQRIGAPNPPSETEVAILLANIDSLPSRVDGVLLEDRDLHLRLHLAGIALFATARLPNPAGILDSFDSVYRLEVPEGMSWSHGVVSVEKSTGGDYPWPGMLSVREVWGELGLDLTLLPPL